MHLLFAGIAARGNVDILLSNAEKLRLVCAGESSHSKTPGHQLCKCRMLIVEIAFARAACFRHRRSAWGERWIPLPLGVAEPAEGL